MTDPSLEEIRQVKAKYEKDLLAIPGVISVGIASNPHPRSRHQHIYSLVILIKKVDDQTLRQIPDHLEGFIITVQQTGPLRPDKP